MLIIVICLLFLSVLVASQGLAKAPNRALLISILLLGAWMMMVFGLQAVFASGHGPTIELAYSRSVFAVGALFLLSLVWFVATILSMEEKTRAALRVALLASGAVIFVLCMSPFVIADATLKESSVMPVPHYGMLMPIYIAALVGAIGVILYMVIRGSRQEKDHLRRQQIRIVGATIFLTSLSGIITNFVVPLLTGDADSSLFMTVSILILIAGLSYAIVKHGSSRYRFALG